MKLRPFCAFKPITSLVLGICFAMPCRAEHGFVLVFVQDVQHRPVRGAEIGIEGIGTFKRTMDDGKAQLPVGSGTKEGDWLSLAILHSPPGKDLVIISPWDNRVQVPSFEDKSENFVRVVVVQRGDRVALEDGNVLASLAAKINKANSSKSTNEQVAREDPKVNLEAVAKSYGLSPDELDQAIRAWGAKTTDPYEAGLAALYERNFPTASAKLQDSLKQREEKLAADQKMVVQDQRHVADAALFLGASLYQQGKYADSAQAYARCLQVRPDDPLVLNNEAVSLVDSGDLGGAEPLYSKALAITEKELGPNDPLVAGILNNQAQILYKRSDFAGAERRYREALAIYEKAQRYSDPKRATTLNNLAVLLQDRNRFEEAEFLFRQALAIDTIPYNSTQLAVARDQNDLAELLRVTHRYAEAEAQIKPSLTIKMKELGPNHPSTIIGLNNLAELLEDEEEYTEAESVFQTALERSTNVLGKDDPTTMKIRANLNALREVKKQAEK